jgi:hypothetical protein
VDTAADFSMGDYPVYDRYTIRDCNITYLQPSYGSMYHILYLDNCDIYHSGGPFSGAAILRYCNIYSGDFTDSFIWMSYCTIHAGTFSMASGPQYYYDSII